jgi:hypothetical protein
MKTFIVGDIHGRCAQLLNLLDMLPRDPSSDTLVFLGDLIDRAQMRQGVWNTFGTCVATIRTGDLFAW